MMDRTTLAAVMETQPLDGVRTSILLQFQPEPCWWKPAFLLVTHLNKLNKSVNSKLKKNQSEKKKLSLSLPFVQTGR